MSILLLAAAFAVILAGAWFFTNATEWLGARLGLGTGAVGSVLAAVATAMPESVIPVVAIIRGDEGSEGVAIGAILGAPFMLATIALALVGLSAVLFRNRRRQGRALDVHRPTLLRDLGFFLAVFGAALLLGLGAPFAVRVAAAPLFVLAYAAYLVLTVRGGGDVQPEEEIDRLALDPTPEDPPPTWLIVPQFALGLAGIIGGAHVLVGELLDLAERIGVDPLVLALLLAPLATELPEKANSFLWVRDGKDALALGNISGAMVFQATIPVAVGLAFTRWELAGFGLLAACLALAGGVVALWAFRGGRRVGAPAILAWAALFTVFGAALAVT